MQIEESTRDQARNIGERVRGARKELGLRQDELAIAAGVSTRAIHQIEHGKPTSRLDTLSRGVGEELDVYRSDEHVGVLERRGPKRYRFRYGDDIRARPAPRAHPFVVEALSATAAPA